MNSIKHTLDRIRKLEFLPPGWTKAKSERILPLPRGWRWLRVGEFPERGDVMHDPRGEPVVQILDADQPLTDSHHPVRRKL